MYNESNEELRDVEVLEGVVMSLDSSSLSVGFSSKGRRTLHTIADGLQKDEVTIRIRSKPKRCT